MAGSARKTSSQMTRSRVRVGFDGALDGLLGHAGHDEQAFFQVVEILLELDRAISRTSR